MWNFPHFFFDGFPKTICYMLIVYGSLNTINRHAIGCLSTKKIANLTTNNQSVKIFEDKCPKFTSTFLTNFIVIIKQSHERGRQLKSKYLL